MSRNCKRSTNAFPNYILLHQDVIKPLIYYQNKRIPLSPIHWYYHILLYIIATNITVCDIKFRKRVRHVANTTQISCVRIHTHACQDYLRDMKQWQVHSFPTQLIVSTVLINCRILKLMYVRYPSVLWIGTQHTSSRGTLAKMCLYIFENLVCLNI